MVQDSRDSHDSTGSMRGVSDLPHSNCRLMPPLPPRHCEGDSPKQSGKTTYGNTGAIALSMRCGNIRRLAGLLRANALAMTWRDVGDVEGCGGRGGILLPYVSTFMYMNLSDKTTFVRDDWNKSAICCCVNHCDMVSIKVLYRG